MKNVNIFLDRPAVVTLRILNLVNWELDRKPFGVMGRGSHRITWDHGFKYHYGVALKYRIEVNGKTEKEELFFPV